MIGNPQLFLYATVLAAAFYYLIPADLPVARRWFVVGFSAMLLFIVAPVAVLVCFALSLLTAALSQVLRRKTTPKPFYWMSLTIPVAMIGVFELLSLKASLVEQLGVSYFALKSISVLVDGRRGQLDATFGQVLALNLFHPIYSAGPIERAGAFDLANFAHPFNAGDIGVGAARLLVGFFKIFFLAGGVLSTIMEERFPGFPAHLTDLSPLEIYLGILIAFLNVYLAFSGYTDVAIGAARLFGVQIRENFNFPLLARSIQNFWQRWHMSLSAFSSNYIFLPFVRSTGRPALGIFLTFTVLGLWHKVSSTYLFWGVMHGAALAINMKYSRFAAKHPRLASAHANPISINLARILTISYVAWLSVFANTGDFAASVRLTRALLGVGP